MQVTVETTNHLERRMLVQLPATAVDEKFNARVKETAKRVRIDGFRPGKVPASVIRQRFGPSIRAEVLEDVIKDAYIEALNQENIKPAGYPRFEDVKDEGDSVEFAALFEVFPEITLGDFSSFKVEQVNPQVTSDNVEKMIESLRQQKASYSDTDRAAQTDDQVVIHFKGFLNGEAFEGGTAENQELVLGSGRMIPGFEDGILGMTAGEQKTITVTFPEDYQNKELAGQQVQFEIDVTAVKEPVLPVIDEAFIQELGARAKDVAGFKEEVQANMEREAKQAANEKTKTAVIDQLIATADFAVPSALIDDEIYRLQQEAVQQFGGASSGFDPSQLPKELFSERAERRVRTGLLFSQITTQNDLKITDEAVQARLKEIASVYQDPDSVIQFYQNNAEQLSQVRTLVLEDSVLEFILLQAQVSTKDADYFEIMDRSEEQA
jgi:trigger factor